MGLMYKPVLYWTTYVAMKILSKELFSLTLSGNCCNWPLLFLLSYFYKELTEERVHTDLRPDNAFSCIPPYTRVKCSIRSTPWRIYSYAFASHHITSHNRVVVTLVPCDFANIKHRRAIFCEIFQRKSSLETRLAISWRESLPSFDHWQKIDDNNMWFDWLKII